MLPRILLASSMVSALLLLVLAAAYFATGSKLALAQAVDSFSDVLTGLALFWVWRLSLKPADANHHYGHQTAQPIAALVMATLVGVMALEVLWNAVEALFSGSHVELTWIVAAGLGAKVCAKVVLVLIARRRNVRTPQPALQAFVVDARSDILVGTLSLLGYFASVEFDRPSLDAWLAIPAAGWVGYSALSLARANVDLLMGAAPPQTWRDTQIERLTKLAAVRRVGRMKARTFSDGIHLWVEIYVDPALTISAAHDIGEFVEAELRREPEVCDAVVHVDADLAERREARP